MSYDKALSYSGVKLFKQCPRLWESNYILKEVRPKSKAADRGTALHDVLERFFRGLTPFPHTEPVLNRWRRFMEHLTLLDPTPEGELAVTKDWFPTAFDAAEAYYRGKADLSHEEDCGETLVIYDWKTGKIYNDHEEQGMTYVALHAHKEYNRYKTVFVYLDHPLEARRFEYSAEQRLEHIEKLREDIEKVREATSFDPTPSPKSCQWCHLSWRKGGKCNVAP